MSESTPFSSVGVPADIPNNILLSRFALETLVREGYFDSVFVTGRSDQIFATGSSNWRVNQVVPEGSHFRYPKSFANRNPPPFGETHIVECLDWFLGLEPADERREDAEGEEQETIKEIKKYFRSRCEYYFAWGWDPLQANLGKITPASAGHPGGHRISLVYPQKDNMAQSIGSWHDDCLEGEPEPLHAIWTKLAAEIFSNWDEQESEFMSALGQSTEIGGNRATNQDVSSLVATNTRPKVVYSTPESMLGYGYQHFDKIKRLISEIGNNHKWLWINSNDSSLANLLIEQIRIHLQNQGKRFTRHRLSRLEDYFLGTRTNGDELVLVEYTPQFRDLFADFSWLSSCDDAKLGNAIIVTDRVSLDSRSSNSQPNLFGGEKKHIHCLSTQIALQWTHLEDRKVWLDLHFPNNPKIHQAVEELCDWKNLDSTSYFGHLQWLSDLIFYSTESEFFAAIEKFEKEPPIVKSGLGNSLNSTRNLLTAVDPIWSLPDKFFCGEDKNVMAKRLSSSLETAIIKTVHSSDKVEDIKDKVQWVLNKCGDILVNPNIRAKKSESTDGASDDFELKISRRDEED